MIKMLNNNIGEDFGEISPVLFYECQTLEDVAEYFEVNHRVRACELFGLEALSDVSDPASVPADTAEAVVSPDFMATSAAIDRDEDIAIIGISGKYPQSSDVYEFWENLKNGRDCITQIPKNRWDYKHYYDADRNAKGKVASKWGGFISDVDCFDADLFNIQHHQADYLDPQERLLLQAAWETFEDSGYTPDRLGRSSSDLPDGTGVYIGCMYTHYPWLVHDRTQGALLANHSIWAIANRISYFFDFNGPSIACDTSCSSALTILHLACSGIKNGDCGTALVGAVNLTLHPSKYFALDRNMMLASHPKSIGLGDGGDGFVPAEGVGAVLLKPLPAAIKDRDNIQGIIKASFVNHGGKTNGFMVPNPLRQEELIVKTLMRAGIHPQSIGYVETAANGSELGDAIEISSLTKAFKRFTQARGYCAIGSVKSNIGHSEAVSGLSQLTKVVMQFKNKMIAPSINCDPVNKHIDLSDSPFYVQRQLSRWARPQMEIDGVTREGPRRAAISSFGGGGSYAHVILEEYRDMGKSDCPMADSTQIAVLSAKNETSLRKYARKLSDFLKANRKNPDLTMLNTAYTLQLGRVPMEERLAMVVPDIDLLISKLADFLQGQPSDGLYRGKVSEQMLQTMEFFNGPEASEFLKITIESRKLEKVAYLWVNGIEPDWSLFYKNCLPKRISLPTYAFEKKRFWVAADGKALDFTEKANLITEPVDKPKDKPVQTKSSRPQSSAGFEPKTIAKKLEIELTEILKALIDVKKISATTNFFDLGVKSITLAQFQDRIKTDLRIDLPMVKFFDASTIRKVSELIAAEGGQFRAADEYVDKEKAPRLQQENGVEKKRVARPDPNSHPVNTSLRNRRKRLKDHEKKQHEYVA
jgi:polyketide synthase PksL